MFGCRGIAGWTLWSASSGRRVCRQLSRSPGGRVATTATPAPEPSRSFFLLRAVRGRANVLATRQQRGGFAPTAVLIECTCNMKPIFSAMNFGARSAPRVASEVWRRYSLASRRGLITGRRCTFACTAQRLLTHDIPHVGYTSRDILYVRDVTRRLCPFSLTSPLSLYRRSSERYVCHIRQGMRRGYIGDSRERGISDRTEVEQQPLSARCTSSFSSLPRRSG